MEMKKSFVLHNDTLGVLDMLSDEQAGKLFKAIKDYQFGIEPELDNLLSIVFLPFRNQFNRDNVKYQNTVERNQENGKKGGRPKKTQDNPKNPSGFSENPKKPKKADNDNDSDNDSESDSVNDTDSGTVNETDIRFSSFHEVEKYMKENNLEFVYHSQNVKNFYEHLSFKNGTFAEQLKLIKNNTKQLQLN